LLRIGFAPVRASALKKCALLVPDFKPSSADPQNTALLKTFNDTFWNDLDNSGVCRTRLQSFYPLQVPGTPPEVTFGVWNSPPPNAAMLAFGNLGVAAGKLTVQGWLYDVKNTASPLVIGKQYGDVPTEDAAASSLTSLPTRLSSASVAASPASRKAKFISSAIARATKKSGSWIMDGSNQRQLSHQSSISLSPRVSPDGSRLAFSSLTKSGWDILMFSTELDRLVSFPHFGGTNLSPSWSPMALTSHSLLRAEDARRFL